jgi:PAS domain S-box-containing protein
MSGATNECVLLIECQPADARLITNALTNYVHGAFAVESIINLPAGLERIAKGGVRAVIVDIEMSNGRSVATIERLLTAAPHIPVLILSATENESVARQAAERGAHDYLLKSNFDNFRLRRAVRAMIEHRAADEQVCLYQQCAELALLCTGDALVISDSAERVTHLNTAAELITGWSEKEAQGQPLSKIFGIVDHDARKAQTSDPSIVSEANRKSPRTSSGSLMRRDCVELNIKNCTAHIRDRDGNIAGMVASFTIWAPRESRRWSFRTRRSMIL